MSRHALFACLLMFTTACASLQVGTTPGPPPKPVALSVQKWFSVDKHEPWYGGCSVRVTPEKKPNLVRIARGWEVAWLVTNECDEAMDLTLTFERNGQPVESPITFDTIVNGVLRGVVKSDAELGRYKYTAKVGEHSKDPDIIIF
jgi:hypothetical protein